jgi:hypothetical protein
LVTLSLIFCIPYMLVAARRLSSGGLKIFLDDTILLCIAARSSDFAGTGWGVGAVESTTMAWGLRFGFPLVTLFELLSPLCLVSRRFRWTWIAVIVPFHIGTGLLMGIWFRYNLALIPFLAGGIDPFQCRSAENLERDHPENVGFVTEESEPLRPAA